MIGLMTAWTRGAPRRRAAGACVLAAAALTGACELREVALAEAEDIIVAEVVLRAGTAAQSALLHRTRAGSGEVRVPFADVQVTAASGGVMRYQPAFIDRCLTPDPDGPLPPSAARIGSCYVAEGAAAIPVVPGESYTLRIVTQEGVELTGTTTVPGAFAIRSPAGSCALPAEGSLLLEWTQAAGAWAYLAEANFDGLRGALAPRGVVVPADPLTLTGVAVGRADTTMALPAAFGLFDRFDSDLTPTLVALQDGIPSNVGVDVLIAAADRNFVNWVRGGNFNPSGLVRVPSVRGGTGVFGSLSLQQVRLETAPESTLPGC